ncbi:MAG: hypothetical protein ACRCTE_09390 [Cellulosilyticaceae bacterium]
MEDILKIVYGLCALGYLAVAVGCCIACFRYGITGIFVGLVGFIFSMMLPVIGLCLALHQKNIVKGLHIIQKETSKLGKNLCDEGVKQYTQKISQIKKIPNKPMAWNALRAAHNMVKGEEDISNDVKKSLKRELQSKGVSGVY